jgi:hypothetical protein
LSEGEEIQPTLPRKKRRQPPELTDEVRMLAYIKRANKPIFQMLEAEAQQLGVPKAKLLEEAISHYLVERKAIQKEMSVAELYEALQFLAEVQRLALTNLFEMMRMYFSEESLSFRELVKMMSPPTAETSFIEEKAILMEKKGLPPDEAQKLREKFFKMFEPFLDWSLELFQKSLTDVLAKYFPGLKPPEIAKASIPVTVTEVEPTAENPEPVVIKVPNKKSEAKKEEEEAEAQT